MNENSFEQEQEQFHELSYYTLAHGDPRFIHQHAVDAFIAQSANENTKPIAVAFSLIGLHLYLERNYTGRQVQLAHMALASRRKEWPRFDLPESRGEIRVADVVNQPAGQQRDEMIRTWCASVWEAYSESHSKVRNLFADCLGDSWYPKA